MPRSLLHLLLALLFTRIAAADVFIGEFDAINCGTATDVNGSQSDWIELRNPDGAAASLNGWALSDVPANPGKWVFPNVSINAGSQLLVFASAKDRAIAGIQLHTNFRLSGTGSIVLSRPDGAGGLIAVHQILDYPKQRPGLTYGLAGVPPSGILGYFETPTPNAPNGGVQVTAFVKDTDFTPERGLYDAPFSLTITSATPGATIIYTTNGTIPTASNGTQVPPPDASTGPTATINITSTAMIRARAIKAGLGATNVDTHSYVFPASVLQQSDSNGQPSLNWSHFGTADWEMDPQVVNAANPSIKPVPDDLKAIPTISVVLNWNDLFGGPTAIYPPASGVANEGVERNASFEFINPEADKANPNLKKGFHEDGVIEVFGGTSPNRWNSDKLSFRIGFCQDVNAKVFGDDATQRFDTLILDARYNNVWNYGGGSSPPAQRDRSDYYGDALVADLHRLMGGTGVHTRLMHLYLNGVYWGMYAVHERPDKHFASDYLGGDEDEWDVVKHNTTNPSFLVDGRIINPAQPVSNTNHTAGVNYQNLLNLSNQNLAVQANYDALLAKLDVDDFIPYMLVNFYVGNSDWAHQNWYASYNRVKPDGKWRYHVWDAEHVMESIGYSGKINQDDPNGPTHIHQRLRTNPEYRLKFADVMHREFFNGGVLTYPRVWDIFDAQMQTFAEAIRAESARWGDNRREPPYTRLDWFTQRNFWQNTYFPARSTVPGTNNNSVFFQLQALYPSAAAPEFNTHGGAVPAGFLLNITNPGGAGTVYYTQDGADPRVPVSSAVSATATAYAGAFTLPGSRTIKARVLNGSTWSALTEAYFSVNTVPAAAGNLVISKIHYRPAAATSSEITAGFNDRNDFEFIEVLNIGAGIVALDGISMVEGLDLALIAGGVREIPPGGRALYVSKPSGFAARYGTGLPIAGEFVLGSNLNNGGERLRLLAADGSAIADFSYDNSAPWPMTPDGMGPSLVLIRPATSDPAVGSNWRASTVADGAPALDERVLYADWQTQFFNAGDPGFPEIAQPGADPDGDGLKNVVELFLGLNPKIPALPASLPAVSVQPLDVGGSVQNYAAFSVRYMKAAEEIDWRAETSTDLNGSWSSAPADLIPVGNPTDNGDGTETRTYRGPLPLATDSQRFFRVYLALP